MCQYLRDSNVDPIVKFSGKFSATGPSVWTIVLEPTSGYCACMEVA